MNCDCLNDCGDDPAVKSGKVQPCENMLARIEQDRLVSKQLAKITELRKVYGASNLYELMDKMQAEVKRLQGVLFEYTDFVRDFRAETDAVRSVLAARNTEIESLREDAEKWRTYKARKDAVIAAGMGRNPLRQKQPCGFTDVVLANDGQYTCSKCGKVMPTQWAHDIVADGLKLPKKG